MYLNIKSNWGNNFYIQLNHGKKTILSFKIQNNRLKVVILWWFHLKMQDRDTINVMLAVLETAKKMPLFIVILRELRPA